MRWVVAVQVMETKQSEEIFYASDGENPLLAFLMKKCRSVKETKNLCRRMGGEHEKTDSV